MVEWSCTQAVVYLTADSANDKTWAINISITVTYTKCKYDLEIYAFTDELYEIKLYSCGNFVEITVCDIWSWF